EKALQTGRSRVRARGGGFHCARAGEGGGAVRKTGDARRFAGVESLCGAPAADAGGAREARTVALRQEEIERRCLVVIPAKAGIQCGSVGLLLLKYPADELPHLRLG